MVAMEQALVPAGNDTCPAETGAGCMRAGVESGDMASTLERMLQCGQQIHLQLLAI
ncbi:MAG TPA: hypothetical protein VN679_05305 [Candidatus Acidoferrales bacterium]|nr:hypothetical protein [Candidatus Acidoferrales bacterium]